MERKTDCIFRLKATKFDYSQGGCKHTDMDGFICTAFASEGKAVWMVGLPNGCMCDMYSPRDGPPPTEKQIEYAKYLAKRACQELPTEFTKQAYSEFISKWKPIVKKEDDEMNEPSSWQMQYL